VNNLPKVVTQCCLEQDLNPRPTDRKPKCLTRCTTAPILCNTLTVKSTVFFVTACTEVQAIAHQKYSPEMSPNEFTPVLKRSGRRELVENLFTITARVDVCTSSATWVGRCHQRAIVCGPLSGAYAVMCAKTPALLVHRMETMQTKSLFLLRQNYVLALESVLCVVPVRVVFVSCSRVLEGTL